MRFHLTFLLAIVSCLPAGAAKLDVSQLPAADVKKGAAVISDGPDFLFAIEAAKKPELYIDGQPAGPMHRAGQDRWTYSGKLKTGISHSFYYMIDGQKVGGKTDVPAFGPDSYEQPGVPHGKLSEKIVHTSKIYEGMQSNYWIYVPAQYDPGKAGGADGLAGWAGACAARWRRPVPDRFR